MKLAAPYRCDYCQVSKGLTNHWWLRQSSSPWFVLLPWDTKLADQEGYEHICSESCASKALSKWMARSIAVQQVEIAQLLTAATGEPAEIPHIEALNAEGQLGCLCTQCVSARSFLRSYANAAVPPDDPPDDLERRVQEVMP